MKRIICYFNTLKEWKDVIWIFWELNAIYINHDYREQKSYIKGDKLYEPLKCKICGNKSVAWRQF